MKWVSLFEAESSVHLLPFFSWWTLQFHKARKKKKRKKRWWRKRRKVRVAEWERGRVCSEGGNAGKMTSGRAGISPFTGIWLVFPLCKNNNKNQKKKIKSKKEIQKWCSKNNDERGRRELLAGMCCWLLCCWFFFCVFFFFFSSFCSVKPRYDLMQSSSSEVWLLLLLLLVSDSEPSSTCASATLLQGVKWRVTPRARGRTPFLCMPFFLSWKKCWTARNLTFVFQLRGYEIFEKAQPR